MIDLRCQLDRERHLRMMLQKQNQSLHLKQEHQTTVEDIPEKRSKDKVVCIVLLVFFKMEINDEK